MLTNMTRILIFALSSIALLMLKLEGATITWTATSSADMNLNTNWSSSTTPGSGDIASFTTPGNTLPEDQSLFNVLGISFTNTAPAYTLTYSGGLDIGTSGVANGGSVTQLFNCSGGSVAFGVGASPGASVTYTLQSTAPLIFLGGTSGLATDTATFSLNGGSTTVTSAGSATNVYVGQFTSSGSVSLGINNKLNINSSSPSSISGMIAGAGGLGVTGTGVLTLSATNTYTGSTLVTTGTLLAGAINTFSSSSPVVMGTAATALLRLSGNSQQIASLSGGGVLGGNVSLGSATLTMGNGTSTSYSGSILGGGGIALVGGGTFNLAGTSNTYSGTTTVSSGTLQSGATNAFSASSTVAMGTSSTAVLDLNGSPQTIGSLSGGGFTGGKVLLSAQLTLGGDNTSTTYSGAITGTGSITMNGSGTFTLGGTNNTYTGTTTVTNGTLAAGAVGSFSANSAVVMGTVAGAALNLNNNSQEIASLSGGSIAGGNVVLGTATLFIANSTNTTYYGSITGTGGLAMVGTGGVFNLAGTNNMYTGQTTVVGGTLQAGATNAFSSVSAFVMQNNAGTLLDLHSFSQTIGSLSGGGTTGGNVNLGSATLTLGGNNTTTSYAGTITGTGGITLVGTGTFTLAGSNTYTGVTTVNSGTLQSGAVNAFSPSSTVVMANVASASLNLNNQSQVIASLSGGGPLGGNVTLGTATLTTGGDGTSTTYSGVISGSGGGLIKLGTGTFTLSGTNNTYTGQTTVNFGTLQAGSTRAFSSSSTVVMGTDSTAVLNLGGLNQTIASISGGGPLGGNVSLGAGTLTSGGDNTTTTYFGAINGTGGMTKTGTGIFTLGGTNNTYSGTTKVDAGTLRGGISGTFSPTSDVVMANVAGAVLDLSGTIQTIGSLSDGGVLGGNVMLGSGTLNTGDTLNTIYYGSISGTGGSVTVQGSGIFNLSGVNNTYTGTTTVNSGTLRGGAVNAFSPSSAVVMANTSGAFLDLADKNQVIASLSGGGGNGGNVFLRSAILTTGGDDTSTTYSGAISGTGGVTKQGTGIFTLNGASNTYYGTTTVNGGTLQGGTVNAFSPNSAVVMANTAGVLLDLNGNSQTITTLSGGGGVGGNVSLGSGTLTVGNSLNTTYYGVIGGSGNVIKTGSGTFTLPGINTLTGTVTVAQGLLNLSGSVGGNAVVNDGAFLNLSGSVGGNAVVNGGAFLNLSGSVGGNAVVNDGALLTGTGTVLGNMTVNYLGMVSPGNSIGTINVGSYTNNAGIYLVEINGAGQSDLINSAGPAILNGGVVSVTTLSGTYDFGTPYTIVQASSVTGTYSGATGSSNLVRPVLSYDSQHVYLGFLLSIVNGASTCNQIAVASQLDTITSPDSAQKDIFNTLINLPNSGLVSVLNELTGQQHTNNLFSAQVANRQFIRRLFDPIRHIVTTKFLKQNYYHPFHGCLFDVNHEDFGLWAEGGPQSTHLGNSDNGIGFNVNGYEATVGAQGTFSPNLVMGVAGSFQQDHMHYRLPGKGRSNTWLGGLYGLFRDSGYYVLADFAYGYSVNTTHRFINIGTQSFKTFSKPKIYQMTGYSEVGVDYAYGRLLVQPFAGVEVGVYRCGRTVESGTSDWNLIIHRKERAVVSTRLGLHAAYHLTLRSALNVDIAWNKRLTNNDIKLTEQFADFGTSFLIDGVVVDNNSLDLAISGSTFIYDHVRLYLEGTGELWNRAYNLNLIGGVELTW